MAGRLKVALALVGDQGRWLVSQRSAGRIFAGLWEFPGGKVDPGESPAAAAVRETLEETGVAVEPIGTLGQVETCHGGRDVTLHLVLCRPRADPPPASSGVPGPEADSPVDEIRWAPLHELRQLAMPPANAEIIDRLVGWTDSAG